MQTAPLIAASGLALGLAACHPLPPRAVARLDCPASSGDLTRISTAADGRSCLYRSAAGADVSLRLLAVGVDARATLEGVEREVRALMATPAKAEAALAPAKARAEETLGVAASAAAISDAERALAEAMSDAARPVAEEIRRDGPEGDVEGDADHASVDLPGIHVRAHGDDADVRLGPVRIIATEGDAVIKVDRDVRLRGESLSREKRGLRATFVMIEDGRAVGYEAAGPRTGPITVAVVQARGDGADDDVMDHRLRRDVTRLVRRNGGA